MLYIFLKESARSQHANKMNGRCQWICAMLLKCVLYSFAERFEIDIVKSTSNILRPCKQLASAILPIKASHALRFMFMNN